MAEVRRRRNRNDAAVRRSMVVWATWVVVAVGGLSLAPVAAGAPSRAPAAWTAPVFQAGSPAPAPTDPVGTTPPVSESTPAQASAACIRGAAFADARRYAATRPGSVSFAVLEGGEMLSSRGAVRYRSASVVKAMLLAADLRRLDRRGAGLPPDARQRLTAMIRTSSNTAASETFDLVGREAVVRVARLVGMTHTVVGAHWGGTEITAADQARFFGRLHTVLPREYRTFARRLLASIVSPQTWGGARVARRAGYEARFKAGWLLRGDGWIVHQGLRLERAGCTIGLAMLTGRQPTMSDGVETMRGIAGRLLDGPVPPA